MSATCDSRSLGLTNSHRRSPTSASGNTSCRSFGALIPACVAHRSNWSSPRSLPSEVAILLLQLLLGAGVSSASASVFKRSFKFHEQQSRRSRCMRRTRQLILVSCAGWSCWMLHMVKSRDVQLSMLLLLLSSMPSMHSISYLSWSIREGLMM